MNCETITYSDHAINQMFKRDISIEDAKEVISSGEIISEYPLDKPFPSYLILGFISKRPLHVLLAKDENNKRCVLITAYDPDPKIWTSDFKFKIK